MLKLFFYPIGCFSLVASLFVITFKNPIKSVLSLIVTYFLTAVLWLLLKAEFLSMLLIIVYVGAVMVLFLFVVMLLDFELLSIKSKYVKFWLVFVVVMLMLSSLLIYFIFKNLDNFSYLINFNVNFLVTSNVKELGNLLYTTYLFEFEIAGFLLFVGIIAAITLLFRGGKSRKIQNPSEQINVKKEQRIFFYT